MPTRMYIEKDGLDDGTPQGVSELKALLERAVLKEREACAKIFDDEADRQEQVWNEHIRSGKGGPATTFHEIYRAASEKIRARSNAEVSRGAQAQVKTNDA